MPVRILQQYDVSAEAYSDGQTLVLNHADTFGVFNSMGDISQIGRGVEGIYHKDTRFVSRFRLKLNGERPVLLSSTIKERNEVLNASMTNPRIPITSKKHIPKGVIHLERSKFILEGACHEKIKFTNFCRTRHELEISIISESDFRDIFEIRGTERKKRGKLLDRKSLSRDKITFAYKGLDNMVRVTQSRFSPVPTEIKENRCIYRIALSPKEQFEVIICMNFSFESEKKEFVPYDKAHKALDRELQQRNRNFTDINTSNEVFDHWVKRSKSDLISLTAKTPHGYYPYAGVPWFNTVFGRDGIITALEVLWAAPEIAKGVLKFLAATQSKKVDEGNDAQPGKILHEMRNGEMVMVGEVPFKKYYGTIDATPLFVVLAGAYYKRTGDLGTIKKIWKNIKAAINWIDNYGDIDGDGFVEYIKNTENGLDNQGWKDSWDSVSHSNGKLAEPPIALCEVQGYVYKAKLMASMLAEKLGEKRLAHKLNNEASALKKLFNETFWVEELNTFALALDKNKNPCKVVSSNAGHCLFSDIVYEKYASKIIRTLLGESLFSEWGVRTLASGSIRYNPMSYHNGSVWPHDTALIAYGLSKYGNRTGVLKIFKGLFNVSVHMPAYRLPELFCGFGKKEEEAPVGYPVACSPQAWSVATLYMLLQATLNMEIDAVQKVIHFTQPVLPDFLKQVSIKNIPLGKEKLDLELMQHKNDVGINVLKKVRGWEIIVKK